MSSHTAPRRVMEAEPQTSASTIPPSLIRTLIPLLAGLLGTFLVDKLGVPVNGEVAGALVTSGIAYTYYAVARFLEVYGSDRWGYILGFRKLPLYATPPLPTAVVVTDSGTNNGEKGALDLATGLLVAGVVALLAAALFVQSQLLFIVAVILIIAGVVLLVTGRRR